MTLLEQQLSTVAARYRRLEWWSSVSVICISLAIVGLALLWLQMSTYWMHPLSGWLLLVAGFGGLLVQWLITRKGFRDHSWIARQIEGHYPELDQRLLTTMDELDRNPEQPLGYLQQVVFQETITHSYHNPWWDVVPQGLLQGFRSRGLAAFWLMVAAAVGLMRWQPPKNAFLVPEFDSTAEYLDAFGDFEVQVEPGNTPVEKGTNLIVIARFGKQTPKEAHLVAAAGSEEIRIPMSRSLEDPLFGGTIPDVQADLEYYVAYGNQRSEKFRATVFTYPELVRGDALLEYPSYTNQPEKIVEDTRRVSVVEGTRVSWEMHLNKPNVTAELVPSEGGDAIPLQVDHKDPLNHLVSVQLDKTATWQLVLKDDEGRENRNPPKITVKVVQNRPPNLKLDFARDAQVSPLEEFLVQATVSDDYGVDEYGLNYSLGGAEPTDVVLGSSAKRLEKRTTDHLLDFEALEAEPDQLLSYYFWAQDHDGQGNVRRTLSDMYFAEVRHFEEIFRQGQQQPQDQQQQQQQQQQGQSQNAQDAEQLAELQKQIINANWNVMRRETGFEVSSKFSDDVSVMLESQQAAAEQVEALGNTVDDPESQRYVMEVRKQMQMSIKELVTAFSESSVAPLTPALTAQQAAYQALLRLRAREHQVVQNQQQSGRPSSSSSRQRFQQQLQQLQLENDRNRYETQRQAQREEDHEQSEVRQALSRLRELAQRQEDLNEQLKELQTALQRAESEEERDEIERQLKRLREQQQEMLRDTDELMDRLNEAQNQEALQETREQLEQTREQLRDSAEALERGNVTPALASGTRAQRELEEMRESLRRESANQFEEQMREMQNRVGELDERQQEIGQQLNQQAAATENTGGLRRKESVEEQKLGEALREQNQKLNDLLQEIQNTVQEAEETEPLLAEGLYDAFRDVEREQVQQKLDRAAQLSDRGLSQPAQQLEGQARESITKLRENIDQAAERVLGDGTDALRTAVRLLEDLERQLDKEINQFDESQPGEDTGFPTEGPAESEALRGADDRTRENGERSASDRPVNDGERRDPSDRSPEQPLDREARADEQGTPRSEQGSDPTGRRAESSDPQRNPQSGPQQNGNGENQESRQGQRSSDESQTGGSPGPPNEQDQQRGLRGSRNPNGRPSGQWDNGGLGGWEQLQIAPITGEDFREWSDRLRDVEEIVGDPELRAEAARIRERARSFRREFKRHSEEPKWELIKSLVARPLRELRQQVSEELLRRSGAKNALVPIDRDPVPEQFAEQVRRYYENLGRGE